MNKKLSIILSVLVIAIISSYFIMYYDEILYNPSITGKPLISTRIVIISETEVMCNFTFAPGWNLVSFPCIAKDIDVSTLLLGLQRPYASIRFYDPTDANDPWKSYNPNLSAEYINDLSDLSRREAYWLYLYNYTPFYINSSLATPTLIDLSTGWNMIGYPSTVARPINDTFGQVIPDFDYVYKYNASDLTDPWKEWTWNTSLYPSAQDLNYTNPYFGYWVYMFKPGTIIVN